MKCSGPVRAMLIGALTATWVVVAGAADRVRAHYEIHVIGSGSDNKINSTFEARPGEQVTVDFPPNQVTMTVQPLADDEYQLVVTVTPRRQSAEVLLRQTFKGTLGQPLELESAGDKGRMAGAISVVIMDK